MPAEPPWTNERLDELNRSLLRSASFELRDPQHAEDAVQEVCVILLERDRDVENLLALSRGILRNVCRQVGERVRRDKAFMKPLVDDPEVLPSDDDVRSLGVRLRELIGALEEPHREVLSLVLENRSSAEMAALLGITESAVRSRKERAVARLADLVRRAPDREDLRARIGAFLALGRRRAATWRSLVVGRTLVASLVLALVTVGVVVVVQPPRAGLLASPGRWTGLDGASSEEPHSIARAKAVRSALPVGNQPTAPDLRKLPAEFQVSEPAGATSQRLGFGAPALIQPGTCALDPPVPVGESAWKAANLRDDVCFSEPGTIEVLEGEARLAMFGRDSGRPGAEGDTSGYLAFYHQVRETDHFRVVCDIFIEDVEDPVGRPVGKLDVRRDLLFGPDAFEAILEDRVGAGWQATSNQVLALLTPGGGLELTDYVLEPGLWHTVELASTPEGSELFAWPADGERPKESLICRLSLGTAEHVLFIGINYKSFAYRVRDVVFEDLSPGDGR